MSRRSSTDAALVDPSPGGFDSHEPSNEVVIDDNQDNNTSLESNGHPNEHASNGSVGGLPPPPPLTPSKQTPIKANGVNGDSKSSNEELKCSKAGCSFSTRRPSELDSHADGHRKEESPVKTGGSKCTMCSQVFNTLEEQIRHMTDFHKLKASFKCSFCRMSFSSKESIEAHIKTHNKSKPEEKPKSAESKEPAPDPSPKKSETEMKNIVLDDNNDSITDEIEPLECLVCGQSFSDPVKHQEHENSCQGPSGEIIADVSQEADYPSYFSHFKHDHINLVTDPNNIFCRGCNKSMNSVLGICNHLSRRAECRDWYCRNLKDEIKRADANRKSQGLPRPEPLPVRTRNHYQRRSLTPNTNSSSPLPESDIPPKRAASLLAQTHIRVTSRGQIVEGFDDKNQPTKRSASPVDMSPRKRNDLRMRGGTIPEPMRFRGSASAGKPGKPEGTHSIQCTHCQKVFEGRSPHVGFTNHQRGNEDCRMHGTRRFISSSDVSTVATVARPQTKREPFPSPPNEIEPVEAELPAKQTGIQYYFCKICNDGEARTRTSLGCHLTVHHGLQPVNVRLNNHDCFRCQNCTEVFNSKHYYNQHRHDCDLKSEYVGFCENNEVPSVTPAKRVRSRNGNASAPAKVVTTPSSSSGGDFNCNLCGKGGFPGPNAVKIHEKYICVNRTKPELYRSSRSASAAAPKVPKLLIKTSRISDSPVKDEEEDQIMQTTDSPRVSRSRTNQFRNSITQGSASPPHESQTQGNRQPKQDSSHLICNNCNRGPYNSIYYLQEHQKNFCRALTRETDSPVKEENQVANLDNYDSQEIDEPSDHRCKICRNGFKNREQLVYHEIACIKSYHSKISSEVKEFVMTRCFVCSICSKACNNLEDKSNHERECLENLYSMAALE